MLSGSGNRRSRTNLILDATRALISAAQATRVQRLVMLSSFGVGETLRRASLPVRMLYQIGKRAHNDKARGEKLLRDSALDWTLVYPVAR